MRRALFAILVMAIGCSPSGHELIVDLRTDLRPGFDFDTVRTTVIEAPDPSFEGERRTLAAAASDDFVSGERIAELRELPAGDFLVGVELLDADARVVASRRSRVTVTGARSVTVVITSDCFRVTCPGAGDPADATECSAGGCVSPECTPESPEACGIGGCASDADCGATVACATGRCLGGACFSEPDDARCAADEYCDVLDGCLARPVEPDAGPGARDAGPGGFDAGPAPVDAGFDGGVGFDAGFDCTGVRCTDGDPCTDDVCVPGSGCSYPPRCGAGEYCDAGACHPDPDLTIETTDGVGCADLGVDHTGPNYTWRRTVTGRPGASFTQFNRHVGCGDPASPAETDTLDGSGTYRDEAHDPAVADCDHPVLGRYAAYVEVDGRRSGTVEVTYFNSSCPAVATCAAARGYCPPCRDCSASEYCYDSSGCAPNPTLTIETMDGAGCADLGTAHGAPGFLWRRTATGRPGATAQQYNTHVSCGGGETPAEAIDLGASGSDVLEATNGADPTCGSPFLGRYRAVVEVDGVRSNTVEITYFNSNCPAVATCALARGYCPP